MESAAKLMRWVLLLLLGTLCVGAQKIAKKEFASAIDIPQYFEDSDVVLLSEFNPLWREGSGRLWRSKDAGTTWDKASAGEGDEKLELSGVESIQMHPFDNKIAFALTAGEIMFYTHDQGETWGILSLPDGLTPSFVPGREIFSFHPGDSRKIILNAQHCLFPGIACEEDAWYSLDGLATINRIDEYTRQCIWARSRAEFKPIADEGGENRIICVETSQTTPFDTDNILRVGDSLENWRDTAKEAALSEGRAVSGIVSVAAVKGYILVAARAEKTSEMALFVSTNGEIWHRAVFNMAHKLEEAYTVLESTNYSIQLVVLNSPDTGVLLSSNSNGTYFEQDLEHLNKNEYGIMDFEKVQGFEGIVLANTVDVPKEGKGRKAKNSKIKSLISFHDGKDRSWKPLKTEDDEELHLHSVSEARNIGRVFSSAAPGVLLGVGNHGTHLKKYTDGDLYVSNDAGRTWRQAHKGPYKYGFAERGNLLLAIPDSDHANKKSLYSTNHGKDWSEFELDDAKFIPHVITTTPDSTSLRVIVTGRRKGDGPDSASVVYSIDFAEVLSGDCKDGDMEEFKALGDDDPCIMGHKQVYKRRKADAKCFIRHEFDEPVAKTEVCKCTKEDFECDFNFVPKEGECRAAPGRKLQAPEGQCKDKDDKFRGPSGFRLIPGNTCKRDGGKELDKEIERPCSDAGSARPPAEKPEISVTEFGKKARVDEAVQKVYLERSETSSGDDETVLMLDQNGLVYISTDHGKVWKEMAEEHSVFADHEIEMIVPHDYDTDAVFFITKSKRVLYSYNRCKYIDSLEVPHAWNLGMFPVRPMAFHQDYKNWFIWTGQDDSGDSRASKFVSTLTRDRGDDWKTLVRYSKGCEFVQRESRGANPDDNDDPADDSSSSDKALKSSNNIIFCKRHQGETPNGPQELVRSANFFDSAESVFKDIVDFATMSEFTMVARAKGEFLTIDASVGGGDFAPAHFPPKFDPNSTAACTMLQSETHAIFIHVVTSMERELAYGRIMKSNSNGTFYVTSVENVNSNSQGYADFEKVRGLEGVSLVNQVLNTAELESGEPKKLQTLITHNDGADWGPLEAPAKGPEGRSWDCKGKKCKIHLRSFTEKRGHPRSYSSDTAIALLIGNGNVGEFLGDPKAKDATFLSTDGGLNWEGVAWDYQYWAYGDQGSVIVLVPQGKAKTLRYSLDEGKNWLPIDFAEDELEILDLTTVPSDNSKMFLIWAKNRDGLVTINVDFSPLRDHDCNLDENNSDSENSDYYFWSPKHPAYEKGKDCIFGHVALYHRKKVEKACWNGKRIDALHDASENCECVSSDFECDFNFERIAEGTCQIVEGFQAPDRSEECRANPDLDEYRQSRGYRRIPLDTCQGGMKLDDDVRPCPGHEPQFDKKHGGLRGFAFFLVAICLPFGAAAGIGYWVYKKWDGKFGAIRLGENGAEGMLDLDKSWVKYPVIVLSGVMAVAMAVPSMISSAWRGINKFVGRPSGVYTSRASFARGRGEYTMVDDEDELLGDDDDDEV